MRETSSVWMCADPQIGGQCRTRPKRIRRLFAVLVTPIFVAVLGILTGCGLSDSEGKFAGSDAANGPSSEYGLADRLRASLYLPDFPFWPNDALIIDQDHLTDLATEYCLMEPGDSPAVDFFLGYLPMRALDDQFCETDPCEPTQVLWGDLYLSGYFGGVWLRELLGWSAGADSVESLRSVFDQIAAAGVGTLDSLEQDGDAQIIAAAESRVFPLVVLYGYNLGFMRRIIEFPPPGIEPLSGLLNCRDDLLLDCDAPALDWEFILRFDQAIDKLRFPPDDRWLAVRRDVDTAADFVAVGDYVWSRIDIDGLDEAAYALLVDLSLNFLFAGKAAALGNATAWAEIRADEGRFALKTDTGMTIWSGSYFMGLASPLEGFPELHCP